MMKTELLSGARKQKVVIEYKVQEGRPEWWVMLNDGQIEVFDNASAALKRVRRAAGRGNKTVTITGIEWRDAPEGWKPPNA